MSEELTALLDHHRVRQTLERYCRGIDRLDADLINSVYWDDSTDNHGIYVGPGPGFADFIIPMLRDNYSATMHVLGQSTLIIAGARAAGDTYFVAYHTRRDGEGMVIDVAAGRYCDKLACRDGAWKILDRVVVMDWVETRRGLEGAAIQLGQFACGRRDGDDVSYDPYRWVTAG